MGRETPHVITPTMQGDNASNRMPTPYGFEQDVGYNPLNGTDSSKLLLVKSLPSHPAYRVKFVYY